ncbi:MAG: Re/Si-specific NAD(P)(+) transhydrogenase subunit alpha [Candidatus Krumholzibacteriia bacterium]|nr:Re/Si-specific NAD(P)(+) transhydrogenase subunit alpha [bacterium]MCB9515907.1 Re/Si-specific NAD(P)(+) transhydrogenase subunit alpha [Candidatus Latescibacterota bacterium]
MIVGIPKETFPGERRVAMVPANMAPLIKAGAELRVERGAGEAAGIVDGAFTEKGASLASREELFAQADVIVQVRSLGANPEAGESDLPLLRKDQVLVGMSDPLGNPQAAAKIAATGATHFSLELIPRITRGQAMDVLSSMATVAGYRAVILAAERLPRMFPMMMTAAGTLTPAHVFIMGAGVAGLQAIASARKLGAVVHAYDVRPAVKEQVESLGGKFVELPLDTAGAEDAGGYAKEQSAEFLAKQRELLSKVIADSDVVITTAAVPGRRAPILVTADMVKGMAPGSVIVDLAAERGGNCELTQPGETAVVGGVSILGPPNLPSDVPFHASQMFAKNVANFLLNMVKEGQLTIDRADEIVDGTLVTQGGAVVNERVKALLS